MGVEKKIVVENNKRVTRKGGVNAGDAIVVVERERESLRRGKIQV